MTNEMNKEIIVADLFVETKKAVAAYKVEAGLIEQQEEELNAEVEALQQELTENILSQENAGVSERVYFKIRGKEIAARSEIIHKVLDELEEEKHALKVKYLGIYRNSLGVDGAVSRQYNVNEMVDRHVYALFTEICSISKQMQEQNAAMYPDLSEVFADERINEEHRNARYGFTHDSYKMPYSEAKNAVIHKQDVFYALSGYMPPEIAIRKPKGGN